MIIKQNVNVEGSGLDLGSRASSSARLFDLERGIQQGSWRRRMMYLGSTVDEPGQLPIADRLRQVEGGNRAELQSGAVQSVEASAEPHTSVSHVRAQSQISSHCHPANMLREEHCPCSRSALPITIHRSILSRGACPLRSPLPILPAGSLLSAHSRAILPGDV